jgi:uncharacterized glyoxalase superfamily protein PhnB
MTKINGVAPVLLVQNVVKAAEYYRDCLGFEYDRLWGDPPDFCMVERNGITVMLSQIARGGKVVPNWRVVDKMWDAYFWVNDVVGIYREFQASGAIIDYTLHLKPYGVKEFGVQDIDGHDLAFGEIVERKG